MAGNIDRAGRPLSPHIGIYRWQWTMTLSILHRATGIALAVGTLLLVWWLVAAASGEEAYATVQACLGSVLGQLALLGWSVAFFYHLCNGIRHLVWDTGRWLDLPSARLSGLVTLVLTAVLTAATWLLAYAMMGKI